MTDQNPVDQKMGSFKDAELPEHQKRLEANPNLQAAMVDAAKHPERAVVSKHRRPRPVADETEG